METGVPSRGRLRAVAPRFDDPTGMLAMWCRQRGLRPPVFVALPIRGGGVEVMGSLFLGEERYLRASHRGAIEEETELEVSRDLFVQVQAIAGPIHVLEPLPLRRETVTERLARRAAEEAQARAQRDARDQEYRAARDIQIHAERSALEREVKQRRGFLAVTARKDGAPRGFRAEGLVQIGRSQVVAGPLWASSSALAEARVVTDLLRRLRELATARESVR